MLSRNIIAAFSIMLCTFSLCYAKQRIESQVGPFNFEGHLTSETELISTYGQGYIQIDKSGGKVLEKKHIYYATDEKVWVDVEISHVLNESLEGDVNTIIITKERLCDEKYEPKTSFGLLITSKGIRIGDTYGTVVEAYGKPSASIDIEKDGSFSVLAEELNRKNGLVIRYLMDQPNDSLFTEFYFDKGVLHSLLLSVSE